MKQKALLTIGLVLSLLMTVAAANAGSAPLSVHMESTMDFTDPDNIHGTFTASGDAVDAGLICGSGMVHDDVEGERTSGWQSNKVMNIYVHKLFVCGDGSGEFEMDMYVHVVLDPLATIANWRLTDGSTPYTGIQGYGSLYGDGTTGGIIDIYDGFVIPH